MKTMVEIYEEKIGDYRKWINGLGLVEGSYSSMEPIDICFIGAFHDERMGTNKIVYVYDFKNPSHAILCKLMFG